jgi:hypothetical protein
MSGETERMVRVILLLAAIEIGGGWLLGSMLGLELPLAFGLVAIVLAVVVAAFILLKAPSHSD